MWSGKSPGSRGRVTENVALMMDCGRVSKIWGQEDLDLIL